MIYLDNAATSFVKPPSVYRAVTEAMLHASSPGRGAHRLSLNAARLVYACREEAAALFHMDDPSRVVFTSNATHALNIAIRSLVKSGSCVLISGFEHNSVTRPLRAINAEVKVAGRSLFEPESVLNDFREKIAGVDAVICTHVSNVFGFVLPIKEIAALCRKRHIPLIVDASQSVGVLDVNMPELGAAFIAMPGHKALFGPQGTGLLLCGTEGVPLMQGGAGFDSASPFMPEELPERLEAGTLNVPGIAGLLEGIRFVRERGTENIRCYERALLEKMIRLLLPLPGIRLFAAENAEQSGILSLSFDAADSETVCAMLNEKGIAARGGLHCAPIAHESAGTIENGTVRLSLSPFVDEGQIRSACRIIRDLF